jgi:hypothetical protein
MANPVYKARYNLKAEDRGGSRFFFDCVNGGVRVASSSALHIQETYKWVIRNNIL